MLVIALTTENYVTGYFLIFIRKIEKCSAFEKAKLKEKLLSQKDQESYVCFTANIVVLLPRTAIYLTSRNWVFSTNLTFLIHRTLQTAALWYKTLNIQIYTVYTIWLGCKDLGVRNIQSVSHQLRSFFAFSHLHFSKFLHFK